MKVAKDKRVRSAAQKAMKISAKVRYALRILMDIAEHQDDPEPRTEMRIAECQNISMKYLSRIVLPLRDAGWISSKRGFTGGFRLLVDPKKINLLDICEIVQGRVTIVDCLGDPCSCSRKADCKSRKIWNKVNDGVRKALSSITLKDAMA